MSRLARHTAPWRYCARRALLRSLAAGGQRSQRRRSRRRTAPRNAEQAPNEHVAVGRTGAKRGVRLDARAAQAEKDLERLERSVARMPGNLDKRRKIADSARKIMAIAVAIDPSRRSKVWSRIYNRAAALESTLDKGRSHHPADPRRQNNRRPFNSPLEQKARLQRRRMRSPGRNRATGEESREVKPRAVTHAKRLRRGGSVWAIPSGLPSLGRRA